MPQLPLVSLVTVFHDREHAVVDSVTSLLQQDYPNLEIVVVDDGSTDATLARLKEFDDPRLDLRSQANRGFTVTLRDTVASTSGEYVAIHDAGDVSHPDRISAQVALAQARPEVGAVGCQVELADEDGPVRSVHEPRISADPTRQLLAANLFTHGEVLFRRSAYEQVGGYREFFTYAQDRDLWLRMSLVAGFAAVPRRLYRRIRFRDGVEGNLDRKLLQSHYAAMAAQCLRMRQRVGYDWVDVYGDRAGICRQRSPELARRVWGMALRAFDDGDATKAAWLAELSAREHPTPRALALCRALALGRHSRTGAAALRSAVRLRYRVRW